MAQEPPASDSDPDASTLRMREQAKPPRDESEVPTLKMQEQPRATPGPAVGGQATQPTLPPAEQPTIPAFPTPRPGARQLRTPRPEEGTRPTVLAGEQGATHFDLAGGSKAHPTGTHRGEIWGDFQFGDLLGKGGMGAVYRGRQVSLDREVAIKVLPPHLSENEHFRERFGIEAKAVARINSPHVIQVYGAGVHQGHHFFAMEFVEGEDLSQLLKKGVRPDHRQTLEWMAQAARGLVAAGEHGIIHRDIKPANMMLTRKGVLKLMDFGLAKLATETQHLTMTGTIMGTVSYFSPEQGRGESCDARTDIYACGVVLYELLTGKLPFTGADATSVIYQHIHVPPRPPRELDPRIPEDLQAVALKCMQKRAGDRYQTAGDLLADLERLLHGQTPAIPPRELVLLRRGADLLTTPLPPPARPRWPLAVGGVALVMAGVGAWAALRVPAPGSSGPDPIPSAQPASAAQPSPPALAARPATAASTAHQPVIVQSLASTAGTPADRVVVATPVPAPGIDQRTRFDALLAEERFGEARELARIRVAADPSDDFWASARQACDRKEAAKMVALGRQACASRDHSAAGRLLGQARTLDPQAPGLAELAAELDTVTAAQARRMALLAQAATLCETGRGEEAVRLLEPLTEAGNDPELIAALEKARRAVAEQLRLQAEARTKVAEGDRFSTLSDWAKARASYEAAGGLDPSCAGAKEGLARVAAAERQASALLAQVEAATKAEDPARAKVLAGQLEAQSPGSEASGRAAALVAAAELAATERQRRAAELEARRSQQANKVLALCDDPKQEVAALEQALAAFIKEAGAGRSEQAVIERRIEDRRQELAFASRLSTLDTAVTEGRPQAISEVVQDQTYAEALASLKRYPGLVFASRLGSFAREGQTAKARVEVRHALSVYPERTLTYLYELRQEDGRWRIAAARLERQP